MKKLLGGVLIILLVLSFNHDPAFAKGKGKAKGHLFITSAMADMDNDLLYIYGLNFGKDPKVALEGEMLVVVLSSDGYIEAELWSGVESGTYRLEVAKKEKDFGKEKKSDMMDVTLGQQGPQGEQGKLGPQGEQGKLGPQGEQGKIGPQGEQGKIGPQGEQGKLGPQGEQGKLGPQGVQGKVGPQGEQGKVGPQGEPGVSGFQRISCGPITVSNPTNNGVGKESVTCLCPSGKVAVAGGITTNTFPITVQRARDFNIAEIHPVNDRQWRVRWYNGTGASVNVTLYTVCVTAN